MWPCFRAYFYIQNDYCITALGKKICIVVFGLMINPSLPLSIQTIIRNQHGCKILYVQGVIFFFEIGMIGAVFEENYGYDPAQAKATILSRVTRK